MKTTNKRSIDPKGDIKETVLGYIRNDSPQADA
jgi:hypothetical protein